jgi:hypothetical protein
VAHCDARVGDATVSLRIIANTGPSRLIDLANLVEGAVGELDALVTDRKPAIGIVEHGDALPIAALACSLGCNRLDASPRERVTYPVEITVKLLIPLALGNFGLFARGSRPQTQKWRHNV